MNLRKKQRTRSGASQPEEFKRQLWASVHRGPPVPISHPIPKLHPPLRSRWRLQDIDTFLGRRVAIIAGCLAICLCAGCTVVRYDSPSGEHFSRAAIGTASALTALDVETGTNGVRRISLRGYRSDSADALGVVTEAAVRAATRP